MSDFPFHAWCPHTGYGISCETKEEAAAAQREIDESMRPVKQAGESAAEEAKLALKSGRGG